LDEAGEKLKTAQEEAALCQQEFEVSTSIPASRWWV
jgi:hypothetical protein